MYTALAKVRMQQRAIPQSIVNLLLDYGERAPAGRGGEIFYFGKRGRQRVCRSKGQSFRDGLRGIGATMWSWPMAKSSRAANDTDGFVGAEF